MISSDSFPNLDFIFEKFELRNCRVALWSAFKFAGFHEGITGPCDVSRSPALSSSSQSEEGCSERKTAASSPTERAGKKRLFLRVFLQLKHPATPGCLQDQREDRRYRKKIKIAYE